MIGGYNFGFNNAPGGGGGGGTIGGSGTLNYLAKFTPNGTTIGNSQLFDNGTNVGVATASPLAKFDVRGTLMSLNGGQTSAVLTPTLSAAYFENKPSTSAVQYGSTSLVQPFGLTSNSTGVYYGSFSQALFTKDTAFNLTNSRYALVGGYSLSGTNVSSGTISGAIGHVSKVQNLGAGSTLNNAYLYYATFFEEADNLGTTTNMYGYYMPDQSGIVGIPSKLYGVYIADTSALNVFLGKVSVGPSPSASATLNVTGEDATSANYALKVNNVSTSTMFSVRNDGFVGVGTIGTYRFAVKGDGTNDIFGVLTSGGASTFWINNNRVTNIDNPSSGVPLQTYGSSTLNNIYQRLSGSESIQYTLEPTLYSLQLSSNVDFQIVPGSSAFKLKYSTGDVAIGGISFGSIAARLHVRGVDATTSNYGLLVENVSGTSMFSVRNDGDVFASRLKVNTSTTPFPQNYFAGIINQDNYLYGLGIWEQSNSYRGLILSVQGGNRADITSNQAIPLSFSINGTEAARIDANYNLNVGLTAGTARVHIKGAGSTSATYSIIAQNAANTIGFSVRNDGVVSMPSLPTSAAGLSAGDLWNNAGVINIV